MENDINIYQGTSDIEVIEAGQRAEYDIQIATAKRYPRNLARVKENCLAIVTMDKETAGTCRYTLPRGGKTLSGPSVHLARIIAQQYGNIRVDAKIKQITEKQVISEAVAFDLETNYAVRIEVRKSIMQNEVKWDEAQKKSIRTGAMVRMNDDMITVTGNAANAISFRNAVLNVVPKGLTEICYNAALRQITGDLTSEDKIIAARNTAIDYLKTTYNVTEDQVLKAIGLRSINQIKTEQIADLRGIAQSLKDGDTTPEEVFHIVEKADTKDVVKAKKEAMKAKTETAKEPETQEPTDGKQELKIGSVEFGDAMEHIRKGGKVEDFTAWIISEAALKILNAIRPVK